jgi:hypothetical protein
MHQAIRVFQEVPLSKNFVVEIYKNVSNLSLPPVLFNEAWQ